MDIIQSNAAKGVNGSTTAYEVFEKVASLSSSAIKLSSEDEGKSWIVEILK